jgi:integrase
MSANIEKRGRMWYWRKTVGNKRKRISLKTGDKALAQTRANALSKAADQERFAIIDAVRSKREVATIGAIFSTFKLAASGRGITSAGQYCSQLANIIRKVHGPEFDVEAAASSILTAELLSKYIAAEFTAAGNDVLAQERAKGTIRSTIVNARAVFARWTSANSVYKTLKLPPLDEFRKLGLPWKIDPAVYHRPPEDLITATITAGRALRTTNPRLYAVFLCSYDLALRAGESMALQWDWFSQHVNGAEITMQADIIRRADFRPKWNMERHVPLNGDTWRELQELRRLPDWSHKGKLIPHVIPGEFATDRYNLVNREFAEWMRSLGWDAKKYPKAAHELRKLMGSEWFSKLTPQYAQEKLGHRNIATTCTFYARLAEKPKALPRESAPAAAKEATA